MGKRKKPHVHSSDSSDPSPKNQKKAWNKTRFNKPILSQNRVLSQANNRSLMPTISGMKKAFPEGPPHHMEQSNKRAENNRLTVPNAWKAPPPQVTSFVWQDPVLAKVKQSTVAAQKTRMSRFNIPKG